MLFPSLALQRHLSTPSDERFENRNFWRKILQATTTNKKAPPVAGVQRK